MTVIALAAPLFLVAVVWEWRRTARRADLRGYEARDTAANLAMGVGNRVLEVGWVLVELAALGWLHERAPIRLGGVTAWIVAVLAVDLAYDWYHRLHHEVRLLWASHVAHHSSRRDNLGRVFRGPGWEPAPTPRPATEVAAA